MAIVNAAGLTEAAKTYDPVLRTLPFVTLAEFAAKLGLNIIEVDNEDVIVNKRRLAGSTGPYKAGAEISYKEEVMRFVESSLKPELTVSKTKDNILNYKDKKVLVMAGTALDMKSKRHPLEQMIIADEVVSHAEDVVFAAFFAERDEDVFSPATAFTGFYPKIDALISEGLIAVDLGNYKASGNLAAPTGGALLTDTTAYEALVEWIGSSHNMLRSSLGGAPELLCAQTVIKNVRAAYRNKVKSFQMPTWAETLAAIQEDAFCPGLVVRTHEALGNGTRLILQKPGNLDLGFNTKRSDQFVQVRNIFEDPNEVQFWIQSAYGTRVRDVHQKMFRTNEQTNTGLDLAGDYTFES